MDKIMDFFKSKMATIIMLITIFIPIELGIAYLISKITWLVIVAVGIAFIGILYSSALLIFGIVDLTKSSIQEYRKNDNLFMGAMAIITLSLSISIFLYGLDSIMLETKGASFKGMADTIITLTPALLSLLGVHYSITMQSKSREQDILLSYKPFLKFQIRVLEQTYCPNDSKLRFDLKIENVADNVCVLKSLSGILVGGNSHKNDVLTFDNGIIGKNDQKEYTDKTISVIAEDLKEGKFLSFKSCKLKLLYEDALNHTYEMILDVDALNHEMIEPKIESIQLLAQ